MAKRNQGNPPLHNQQGKRPKIFTLRMMVPANDGESQSESTRPSQVVGDPAAVGGVSAGRSPQQSFLHSKFFGLSPFTWAILTGALGMQYFGSSNKERKNDRAVRSEQQRAQEAAGMAPETLEQIKVWADQYISVSQMPGAVISICHENKLIYKEAFGSYSTDTFFSLRELGQVMVTAACLSLVDAGKFSIDDPVCRYLPSFENFRVLRYPLTKKKTGEWATEPMKSPILIRHLLNHTWGFPAGRPFQSTNVATAYFDAEAARLSKFLHPGNEKHFEELSKIPLLYQPGCKFRKSVGIDVFAHIACKVTGLSLDRIVYESIFAPCKMFESGWFVDGKNKHRTVTQNIAVPAYTGKVGLYFTGKEEGHSSWLGWRTSETKRRVPIGQVDREQVNSNTIYSTCEDVMKFQSLLMNRGTLHGQRILSEDTVALLTCNSLEENNLNDDAFNTHASDKLNSAGHHPSLGVGAPGQGISCGGASVIVDPGTARVAGSIGSYSAQGNLGTEFWNDPVQKISVFFGTQVTPYHAFPQIRQELAAFVYGSLLPRVASPFFVPPVENQPSTTMNTIMNIMMYMMMFMPMGGNL